MDATTTWHDARQASPRDGDLVLAAVTGRHPADPGEAPSPEQDFWLVLPTLPGLGALELTGAGVAAALAAARGLGPAVAETGTDAEPARRSGH